MTLVRATYALTLSCVVLVMLASAAVAGELGSLPAASICASQQASVSAKQAAHGHILRPDQDPRYWEELRILFPDYHFTPTIRGKGFDFFMQSHDGSQLFRMEHMGLGNHQGVPYANTTFRGDEFVDPFLESLEKHILRKPEATLTFIDLRYLPNAADEAGRVFGHAADMVEHSLSFGTEFSAQAQQRPLLMAVVVDGNEVMLQRVGDELVLHKVTNGDIQSVLGGRRAATLNTRGANTGSLSGGSAVRGVSFVAGLGTEVLCQSMASYAQYRDDFLDDQRRRNADYAISQQAWKSNQAMADAGLISRDMVARPPIEPESPWGPGSRNFTPRPPTFYEWITGAPAQWWNSPGVRLMTGRRLNSR